MTSATAPTSTIHWDRDDDGIIVLTIDDADRSVNTMNNAYLDSMRKALERIRQELDSIRGIVLASGKETFFAGADLNDLKAARREDAQTFAAWLRDTKAILRELETLGIPVVAAINGATLGAGLELALATHHRILVDEPRAVLGFPEVTFGLLPGAGGIVRSVRMLGIAEALTQLLLDGQRLKPANAKKLGIVDELVGSAADLLPAAKRWIIAQPDDFAGQPWDQKSYKIPGGTPADPKVFVNLPAFQARLRRQLRGANYHAPYHILAAAVEGAQVDFSTALEIESRYFVDLVTGQVSKNMIQAFFFDMQAVKGNRGRPEGVEPFRPRKLVVLGAGMMGAAIAYVCAQAGIEVILKDVDQVSAERGKGYSVKLVETAISRGRQSHEQGESLLARIVPTTDPAAAVGADCVIEAVFEDPALKAKVFAEIEPHLAPDALIGSNTSTLPITELAETVSRPADFIGLHFFSPVDKMPLLEIIAGEQSSEQTLHRALDLAKLIRKTPIVVNDSRGFFTSRVIGTFLSEGIAMLLEGIPPTTIEQASGQAGYPAPVLQLSDELNLKLMRRVRNASKAAGGTRSTGWDAHPAEQVIDRMIDEFDRPGKLEGRGFYEYENGKRIRLWAGLRQAFPPVQEPSTIRIRDLEERMLFIEALEAVKCLDEEVIGSVADANIGSILGIGFPGWTGGVLQYINGYTPAGGSVPTGVTGFVARARELAAAYGERFEPPESLLMKAARDEVYSDGPAPGTVV